MIKTLGELSLDGLVCSVLEAVLEQTSDTLWVEEHTPCSYPFASLVSNPLYKYIPLLGRGGEGYEHQQAFWEKGYVQAHLKIQHGPTGSIAAASTN